MKIYPDYLVAHLARPIELDSFEVEDIAERIEDAIKDLEVSEEGRQSFEMEFEGDKDGKQWFVTFDVSVYLIPDMIYEGRSYDGMSPGYCEKRLKIDSIDLTCINAYIDDYEAIIKDTSEIENLITDELIVESYGF